MPPKAKFKKEEIITAALDIVREKGLEALTARSLGIRLGSSSCPVFTVFQNMEEVQKAVMDAARVLYKGYIEKGLSGAPAFKGVGIQYIRFATEEPKLFQLLFMAEHETIPGFSSILQIIDENYHKILSSIIEEYGITNSHAEKLYRHLWIYSHGIATLCATKMCRFTGQEISEMLTEVFISLHQKNERRKIQ